MQVLASSWPRQVEFTLTSHGGLQSHPPAPAVLLEFCVVIGWRLLQGSKVPHRGVHKEAG